MVACLENRLCQRRKIFTTDLLFLIWFHPFPCHGFTFVLRVVSSVVGKVVVYEFHSLVEEMGLGFSLFRPSATPCVPRMWTGTSHSHSPMMRSGRGGLALAFVCFWVVRRGPAHVASVGLPCKEPVGPVEICRYLDGIDFFWRATLSVFSANTLTM